MMKNIETDRLKFRELVHADVSNLQRIFADGVAMKFYPSTKSEKETKEWIKWNRESYRDNGYGLWALIEKSSGTFVGQCGLILQCDVDGQDEIEIGYSLVRKYWRQGFATEAASACREYAFSELGCNRVISLIDTGNAPSIRVAQRNGLEFEKNIQRWGKKMGVYARLRNNSNEAYN